jgi:hypothetical protein
MTKYAKPSLLLLGSFAIGYNAAHAIHELGHAIAVWFYGGSVTGMSLHPFSWSKIHYSVQVTVPIAMAGPLFSTLAGVLMLALAWRWRSSWALPLIVTGLCTFIVNAVYLGVDGILLSGGDATALIRLGVSRPAVVGAGMFLLVPGFTAAMLPLPRLGIGHDDGLVARLLVLWIGIGSYLLAMFAYHLIFNTKEILLWGVYAGVGLILISVWAVVFPLAESRLAWIRRQQTSDTGCGPPIATAAVGAAVVITELVMR